NDPQSRATARIAFSVTSSIPALAMCSPAPEQFRSGDTQEPPTSSLTTLALSIDEEGPPLFFPFALVGNGQRVEIAGRHISIVDSLAQEGRAVDEVDGQFVELTLMR